MKTALVASLAAGWWLSSAIAQIPKSEPQELIPAPFERYFTRRVAEIASVDWQSGITPQNWPATQAQMRRELQAMLGLDPWPERTPLNVVIVGTVKGDGYIVEKLHYESVPGLY